MPSLTSRTQHNKMALLGAYEQQKKCQDAGFRNASRFKWPLQSSLVKISINASLIYNANIILCSIYKYWDHPTEAKVHNFTKHRKTISKGAKQRRIKCKASLWGQRETRISFRNWENSSSAAHLGMHPLAFPTFLTLFRLSSMVFSMLMSPPRCEPSLRTSRKYPKRMIGATAFFEWRSSRFHSYSQICSSNSPRESATFKEKLKLVSP